MGFIKRKLRNWLSDVNEVAVREEVQQDIGIRDHENAIHFSVLSANGGRIIQVRYTDRKTDRTQVKLHIVTPDEDLAVALAHILSIETISR